jgi:hypothetical protein
MATIPLWLLGRHLTVCTFQPLKTDASGNLVASTVGTRTITTLIDDIRYAGRITTRDIRAVNATRKNPVLIEQCDAVSFSVIQRAAADSNDLAACWVGSDNPDYGLFTFTWGSNVVSFYGMMDGYEEEGNKDKSPARLRLKFIDASGVTNPSLA